MPSMRTIADGDVLRVQTVTFEPGRRDPTAMRRRERHGTAARTSGHAGGALPVETRNGLPDFKPYVYRGAGYDIYSGEGDDDA